MKKKILMLMLIAISTIVVVSCDDDDPTPQATCSDGIQNGDETGVDCGGSCTPCADASELEGEVTDAVTLDASVEYKLTAAYVVKEGGKLTIPAGTTIKATGGTSAYIAVAQGGQIFIEGTKDKPVIMTSNSDSPKAGDWGGLVICGKAPTNVGTTATSEVADLTYGGTVSNDNSGSIKYLRIEYTGATFNSSKEFNGLSLFGVGSGTTIEYVQSYEGGDDGIEFFGGTVSGKYLVSTNSGDDSIDFADGWNGTGEYWYISGGAKAGIEGSNNGDNGNATPETTAVLKNITVVGPVTEGALYFKEGGGDMTIDNFYIYGADKGVKVKSSDAEAIARIDGGKLKMTNVQFAEKTSDFTLTDYTGSANFITEGIATGAGNGAGVPSWAQGWTKGLTDSAVSKEDLAGEVTGEVSLKADIEYQLTSSFVVKDGGKLIIPAGTTIKATGGTSAYIAVAQGGQIFVEGTEDNPVVMTSGLDSPAAGDWGGLVICGKAPTNVGTTATSEVADLTYGGTVSDDNSGSIKYLRIEYTGATFNSSKEFNGLSLFGVGSGTTVEYVQSYEGGDDGIEFFGGTVSGKYLVSTNSGDDSIDFADGWSGTGEYWYISGGAKAGIEGSNNGDNGNATPETTAVLKNITVVGPVTEGALYFKEGGGDMTIDNFYIYGADKGVKVKSSDAEAIARIDGGKLKMTNVQFAEKTSDFTLTDYTGSANFITEGVTNGAGAGAAVPNWAKGWTKGLTDSVASKEDLAGEVTGEVSLVSNIEYQLTSSFVVKDGGKLTIPAGTTIKATGGTSAYIAVAQGGQIFVEGTKDDPVVMTSGLDSPAAGDWGGLVICGKAPTNVGTTATSEVADLTYGGTVSDDNSGSIKYLRIEYTGATFNSSKEFNGLSLFGVGSGTTIEYVQSYEGGDDGIEFFGGTVSGKYLVSTNSGDDSIDFADGWNGTGEYWYISGGAKAGIEGSNNGDNGNATPETTAVLKNITVVGPVTEGALYFKEGGGDVTIDNFYIYGVNKGVKVKSSDAEAIARIDGGKLKMTNVQFVEKTSDFTLTDYTGSTNFLTEGTATGAGNGKDAPDWAQGWTKGI